MGSQSRWGLIVIKVANGEAMTVDLYDLKTEAHLFRINFWHWRAIVEAVRRLGALPDDRVDGLHEPFSGELTEKEAHTVAAAIRKSLLPDLMENERLLLDGSRTTAPDDFVFHKALEEQHKNYGTNRCVLEGFAECCEACHGFRIM
jgi:hypothetical protein